jgi:hypothetical protein
LQKRILALIIFGLLAIAGCGVVTKSEENAESGGEKQPVSQQQNEEKVKNKTQPVIDSYDTNPLPILSGWKEELYKVTEYDEGLNLEIVHTFDGDVSEEGIAYFELLEEQGFELNPLLATNFSVRAVIAGISFGGGCSFLEKEEFSEFGSESNYVRCDLSERKE